MMTDISLKYIYLVPVVQAIVLICGTFFSLIIAYSRGNVSLYLPFISETGAYSPEKCVFSLSLIIGSFLGSITIFSKFIITCQSQLSEERVFSWLNATSLYIGLASMLGLAGVAAFPMTTVFWAHLLFAAIYFVGNGGYFILISIITYKIEGQSKKFILRLTLCVCIIICLLLIVILFPLSLVRWHKYNDFIPALKTPENKGFTLLLLSSILEWTIVVIIIVFTLSFIPELKRYYFQIAVTDPSKSTAVTEATTAPQD